MASNYKVLGRLAPAANTATTLYTVPANYNAIVSTLMVCNQNTSASTYRIAVRPGGATLDPKHYIAYDAAIPAQDTVGLTIGLTMSATDVLTVSSANSLTSFNLFGSEVIPAFVADSIDILVVAGGGTGGIITSNRGSGGGAGGLIYISSFPVISGQTYTITIGAGGSSSNGTASSNGNNSVFTGAARTLTAVGGGSGGYNDNTNNGAAGGSGGGQWYAGYTGAASTQPANTYDGVNTWNGAGFGYKGGDSSSTQPYGSGGGGAGGAGGNYNGANGPVGGLGKTYDISSTSTTYAGGGSSGGYPAQGGQVVFNNASYGGLGGGGTGYNDAYNVLANATANTGGGGGSGGSGGSGVVIIRYPYGRAAPASTTGSPGVISNGVYNIYKWTSSGSITF